MILVERNERILHLNLNVPPVNVFETAALKESADKLKGASTGNTIDPKAMSTINKWKL